MDLIIVESPSKAKTIAKYLGKEYLVDASSGHIRDLPEKRLGVDIENNFKPDYVLNPSKKDIVKRLTEKIKKADKVYLATDPDREGEAISWHLQKVLNLEDEENRITFNEISAKSVKEALKSPRKVDINLVDAQQARRVLDRLVGYKLSPLLCKKIQSGLSGGRVQSVALRLIVDREREITAFIPEEYWTIKAKLQDKEQKYSPFNANLTEYKNKKIKPKNKEENDAVLEGLKGANYTITDVKKSVSKVHALPPFTTSTLQQDGSSRLGLSAPNIMQLAQHLYEGIDTPTEGHIAFVTYIRTDSVRVSAEAQAKAREYIKEKFGSEYVPEKPNFYKSKKDAQDAHEAIRPIDLNRTPEMAKALLDKNHYRLYKLIYERFLASQMADAQYNTMSIDILANDYKFKATGKSLLFKGYTACYEDKKTEEDEEGKLLPNLNVGDEVDCLNLNGEQKFTKPPTRYTEATLVKTMEDKGIGRPSTYATIISVLFKRKYCEKEGKNIKPTDIAYQITDLLIKHFSDIVDVSFTATMEDSLDKIEEGGIKWQNIIAEFYPTFKANLVKASGEGEETGEFCPNCGGKLVYRAGKFGKFIACSNYPKCKYVKNENQESSDVKCDKCGATMVVKNGKYGKFLACPNYPKCKNIKPYGEDKLTEVTCDKCGEKMYEREGQYGKYLVCPKCNATKNVDIEMGVCPECGKPTIKKMSKKYNKPFYVCADYPNCKFYSWEVPSGEKCSVCGSYMIKKVRKDVCSNKECPSKAKKKNDESKS